jgi:hypothetical protein
LKVFKGFVKSGFSQISSLEHHNVVGTGRTKSLCFEHLQLVANLGCFLKVQVFGVFHHLFFKLLDSLGNVFLAHLLDFGALDGSQL